MKKKCDPKKVALVVACSLFGAASLATFILPSEWVNGPLGWFNLARLAVYLIFLSLLFMIFRDSPDTDDGVQAKWVKYLVIILPIVAVGVAILNAAFPWAGSFVRQAGSMRQWQDRPGIIIKVIFELVACGFFISLLPRLRRQKQWLPIVAVAALSLVLIVMAGEELSWGQRIFQWETGEFFIENNAQGETNLHNLATHLFQNVLYFGGFVLLVALPFFKKHIAKLFSGTKKLKGLIPFLPESWFLPAFGAMLVFTDPIFENCISGYRFGSICFQLVATIAILTICAIRSRKPVVFSTLACAVVVLALNLAFDGLWKINQGLPTEWLELFITFGILCWAIRVRANVKKLA